LVDRALALNRHAAQLHGLVAQAAPEVEEPRLLSVLAVGGAWALAQQVLRRRRHLVLGKTGTTNTVNPAGYRV
jgi:hypothetical protein